MSFLPLMAKKINTKKTGILYFVVQSVGSLIILRGGVLRDWNSFIRKWVSLGVLLKGRLAPFHFWGAALVVNMRDLVSFLFLTWQKIAPLLILLIASSKYLLILFVLSNVLISSRCRIGTKQIKILLFFSGLIHMSWIISAPVVVSSYYFSIYTLTLLPLFLPNTQFIRAVLLLNLAGLPPMTGFIIKLNALQRISFGLG